MIRSGMTISLLLCAGLAQAESALTNRATELLEQAQSDGKTIATIPENTKVDVLRRTGAWSQVKTAVPQTGWVRMLSLKFESGASTGSSSSSNGLSSLLAAGRTGNTATTTTGVKGLTAEDLSNAQANPAELARVQKYAADQKVAQAFAQRARLSKTSLAYLEAPAGASSNSGTSGTSDNTAAPTGM